MIQKSQLGQLSFYLPAESWRGQGVPRVPSVAHTMTAVQEHDLAGQDSARRAASWGWSEKLTTEKTLTEQDTK